MYKYKDNNPIQTINNLKNIFNQKNIQLKIEEKNKDNFYSNQIFIINTQLTYNGKGYTQDFALASGYAETIERISNMSSYFSFLPKFLSTNFNRQPDEQFLNISNLNYLSEQQICQALNKNKEFMLPFYNYFNKNDIFYTSIELSSYIYGSNGMAAGNTLEEALTQGICEVFERYITNQLLYNQISLIEIPLEFLKQFNFYKEIENIQEQGYQITFYDFFNTTGFPVVACQILNPLTKHFGLRFGSHLIFEIALERTLTELFQGHIDLEEITEMCSFSFNINQTQYWRNINNIFTKGFGYIPFYPFHNINNTQFIPWKEYQLTSNNDILNYLLKIIQNKNLKLYYRDTSFLGFPTCFIIIPKLSEVFELDQNRINYIIDQIITKKEPTYISDTTLEAHQRIYDSFEY